MADHLHSIPDGGRRSGTLLDDIRLESDGMHNRQACLFSSDAYSDTRCLTPQLAGRGYVKYTANFTKGAAARCHVGGRDRRHCDWDVGKESSTLSSRHRAAGSAIKLPSCNLDLIPY